MAKATARGYYLSAVRQRVSGGKMAASDIKTIDKEEFEALNGPSPAKKQLVLEEVEFFFNNSSGDLGVLTRDRTDDDYGYAVLQKQKGQPYRAIKAEVSISSRDDARKELLKHLA
ncbi:hypothetical protein [Corallococcus aberystwythensis]|uniref:hypothetical protein n=1 Tax=Corallococcus aberystwythensis TaxID=2316722 RepID=UPI0013157AEA|nr:hypothetical protein [Corallococcus aberystwythensis]